MIGKYFSHNLFIPLTMSFKEKNKILMKIYWFCFMNSAFGDISRKSFPNLRSQRFFPMFPSRCLIVLGFIFRTMIHFEVIFIYMQSLGLCLLFHMWITSSSSTIYEKTGVCTFFENQSIIYLWVYSKFTIQLHWSKICCCGGNMQIHTDYRNPVEKKGLHGHSPS